jgi:hypothetical protein
MADKPIDWSKKSAPKLEPQGKQKEARAVALDRLEESLARLKDPTIPLKKIQRKVWIGKKKDNKPKVDEDGQQITKESTVKPQPCYKFKGGKYYVGIYYGKDIIPLEPWLKNDNEVLIADNQKEAIQAHEALIEQIKKGTFDEALKAAQKAVADEIEEGKEKKKAEKLAKETAE